MTLVGLMTAVICVIAPFSITIPFSPIPLSLGTLAVYFTVSVLGMKQGLLSILLYLLLGLAGIPVFSNFTGGIGKILGPTGGYLLGYLFLAFIGGIFIGKWPGNFFLRFTGMLLGTVVCYLFGTLWLSYQAAMTFSQALISAVVPCLPMDIVKIFVGLFVGQQIRIRLLKAGLICT